MPRPVKLGRKPLGSGISAAGAAVASLHHWAVQVGDTWYEISADKSSGGKKGNKRNVVDKSYGCYADSGAGKLGGELVGKTDKTDYEISNWIERWIVNHPGYDALGTNCQTFAYEFMDWLTGGNFICPHRFNAADLEIDRPHKLSTSAVAKGGNAVARAGSNEARGSYGIANGSARTLNAQAQAVAGPGFGVWGARPFVGWRDPLVM